MEIYQSRKAGMKLLGGRRGRRGQSLVEFALTLPVLLTILAGVVEVANVLTIYNRVQLSAREGARFGAEGGGNEEVWQVVQQASKDSLVVADDRMKVWVIRPTLDISPGGVWSWKDATPAPPAGSAFLSWGPAPDPMGARTPTVACVYPDTCTDTDSMPVSAANVLSAMQGASIANTGMSGNRFVVVIVAYDTDLLLNLPWFSRQGGRFPMWAYAILREEVNEQAMTLQESGCSAFPIALNKALITDETELAPINDPDSDGQPNPIVKNANVGEVGSHEGFAFLVWDPDFAGFTAPIHSTSKNCGDGVSYEGSMRYPGNSKTELCGYDNPLDESDHDLNIGDWVALNHAPNVSNVQAILDGQQNQGGNHIALGRKLPIIIYEYNGSSDPALANPATIGSGPYAGQAAYKISDFAYVIITANSNPGNSLSFRFWGWAKSCGK